MDVWGWCALLGGLWVPARKTLHGWRGSRCAVDGIVCLSIFDRAHGLVIVVARSVRHYAEFHIPKKISTTSLQVVSSDHERRVATSAGRPMRAPMRPNVVLTLLAPMRPNVVLTLLSYCVQRVHASCLTL